MSNSCPADVFEHLLRRMINIVFQKKHFNDMFPQSKNNSCQHPKFVSSDDNLIQIKLLLEHPLCKQCVYGIFADDTNTDSSNLIRHCNINKFMYCQSNTWKVRVIGNCVSWLEWATTMNDEDLENDKLIHLLVYSLSPLLYNIGLLKTKHWKFMTFKCSFMVTLFQFVHKLFSHVANNPDFLHRVLPFLLVLYWKWLDFFKKYKSTHANKFIVQCMEKQLIHFCKIIKPILLYCQDIHAEMTFVVRGFSEAINEYGRYQNFIDAHFVTLWRARRGNEKCQRLKCKVKRKNEMKWLKCSKCLVATYCSKKCAKFDWKHGNHKKYCDVYKCWQL
eukprot:240069_1